MALVIERAGCRKVDQLRPITLSYGICGNADGSVLFQMGNTKVMCTVTMQEGVPHFLRGKKEGWLTAEYSMLPASTHVRTVREAAVMKRSSRSLEISRLIGRCLRTVVDVTALGERTIYIDCDVIQADGGTRTAALNGAYCALRYAANGPWAAFLKKDLFKDTIGAVSVGWKDNQALLDIDFEEDSSTDADFNFVMTGSGNIIEIQGTSEKKPLSWSALEQMNQYASQAIKTIVQQMNTDLAAQQHVVTPATTTSVPQEKTTAAGFRLGLTAVQR